MTHFWDDFPVMKHDIERVHDVILNNVRSRNETITRALTNLSNRNGKMLRPGFVLLSARLQGDLADQPQSSESGRGSTVLGSIRARRKRSSESTSLDATSRSHAATVDVRPLPEKIYNVAAAIEMLHMATLIHDDVIDEADVRRGEPTLHVEFGRKEAILMGDYLFSRTYRLMADNTSIENAKRLAIVVSQIVAGEIDQSVPAARLEYTPRTYIRRVVGKTATLIADSFYLGASEAGMGFTRSSYLRRIGYSIGMAFQIMDDILDFTGTADVLGKVPGSDLRQGIITLPLIYALRSSQPETVFQRLLSPETLTDSDLGEIIVSIERCGGFSLARERAALYTQRALGQIAMLPRGENRDMLSGVTQMLLDRSY